MNTLSKEIPEEGKQRRNSTGGKTRRYSIGITSSLKSNVEEANIVPNYLRASTGSCHDFCKYGKKHEHSSSSIPIKFKKSTVLNKEVVTRSGVPLERKKATWTKLEPLADPKTRTPVESIELAQKDVSIPSRRAQVLKHGISTNGKATENELKMLHHPTSNVKPNPLVGNPDGINGRIKEEEIRTVKKMGVTPKTAAVKKVSMKTIPIESKSPKASSLKMIKERSVKQVPPLKDQNRMTKTKPKKNNILNVHTKALHSVEVESDAKPDTMEFGFTHPSDEIVQSKELINATVTDNLDSSSDKNVVEEALIIMHPVYENSEVTPDKELLEESSIVLPVVESSQSSSDKEVLEEDSLISPPVSESSQSFYDGEVLEDESEYTDEEVAFSGEESEITDDEEAFVSVNNDEVEMGASVGNGGKIQRKGRMVYSEDKDNEAVKLRFRRGKVLDLQPENNGPKRLKFRRRVIHRNEEESQIILKRTSKNSSLDVQTETDDSRRLKFSEGKVMEGNEASHRVSKRTFEKKSIKESNDSNHGPESVVLKHQGEQGKKDAQGLFNNVIEETASKLVESRKSKVKALVGAFETVISLQDGKPASTL